MLLSDCFLKVCSVLILQKVPCGALKIDPAYPVLPGFLTLNAALVHHEFHGALMGAITQRKSAKDVVSIRAQVRLKEGGELTLSESKTFTWHALAQEWLGRCEAEIEEAQATGQPVQGLVTLKQILQDYVSDAKGIMAWGRARWVMLSAFWHI